MPPFSSRGAEISWNEIHFNRVIPVFVTSVALPSGELKEVQEDWTGVYSEDTGDAVAERIPPKLPTAGIPKRVLKSVEAVPPPIKWHVSTAKARQLRNDHYTYHRGQEIVVAGCPLCKQPALVPKPEIPPQNPRKKRIFTQLYDYTGKQCHLRVFLPGESVLRNAFLGYFPSNVHVVYARVVATGQLEQKGWKLRMKKTSAADFTTLTEEDRTKITEQVTGRIQRMFDNDETPPLERRASQ
jgi:hypothetical protein